MYKTKIINTSYSIIIQSTNTVLQHAGIKYAVILFGNQPRYLSWAVPKGKFDVFINLFLQIVCNIFCLKPILFAHQMTKMSLS